MTPSTSSAPVATLDLSRIAQDLQIRKIHVEAVVQLLDEQNTVPFITRYRKERTGGLNEEVIRRIQHRVQQLRHLAERKQTILKSIEGQGKLTDELREAIAAADSPKRLEDLYLPFKPKKRTLATEAREKGLEPLAMAVWTRDPVAANLAEVSAAAVNPEKGLNTADDVLAGVKNILAEVISELADLRGAVRRLVWDSTTIGSIRHEGLPDAKGQEYKGYFEFKESVQTIPPHRILAINRGEKEGALKVKLDYDLDKVRATALGAVPLADHPHREFLTTVLDDALTRLVLPGIEREVRRELTDFALEHAVSIFARNLRSLLLQRPLRGKRILGIDPGLRTGCKLAALDEYGNVLEHSVIYPHTVNRKDEAFRRLESRLRLEEMIRKHQLSVVAIGNGTACRETEKLVSDLISDLETRQFGGEPKIELPQPKADQSATVVSHAVVTVAGEAQVTFEVSAPPPVAEQNPHDGSSAILVGSTASDAVAATTSDSAQPAIAAAAPETAEVAHVVAPPPERWQFSMTDSAPPVEAALAPADEVAAPAPVVTAQANDSDSPPEASATMPNEPSQSTDATAPTGESTSPAVTEATPSTEGQPSGDAPAAAPAEATSSPAAPTPPAPKPPRPQPELPKIDFAALSPAPADLAYVVVNEAGASDYSASDVAREEFPSFDATVRSTISIGRRLQDPLAELVKIDPQHVGVGLYQHDVKARHLRESLDGVVESCVNHVGVDLNTASVPLLRHVSGLNALAARELVEHRKQNGPFKSREQLQSVAGMGPQRCTQAAGFLKISSGDEPLDETWIHPESYPIARKILEDVGYAPNDLRDKAKLGELQEKLTKVHAEVYAEKFNSGIPTVKDIFDALARPLRDPRDELPPPVFRKNILKIEDLQVGMELKGTVLNVVDFGAFVDIGLKDSGLVHISQMANRYIKNPYEVASVGDVVTVWVRTVDMERRHVALTMIPPGTERKPPERRQGQGRGPLPPREPRRDAPPPRRDQQGQPAGQEHGQAPPQHHEQGQGQGHGGPPRRGRGSRGGFRRPQGQPNPTGQGGSAPAHGGAQGTLPNQSQGPPQQQRPHRPEGKPKPLPKLTQEALKGKSPLFSFGELAAFFKAKEDPIPAPPAASPPEPTAPAPTEPTAPAPTEPAANAPEAEPPPS
jgi:protein Tex